MKLDYDPLAPSYDQRYAASPMHATKTALLSLAEKIHPRRVLEVGCGTGHWLAALVRLGYATFGLDFSAGMLALARQSGAYLARADALSLPFAAETFDLAFCINALHHFGNPRRFIRDAAHRLAPGGVLAIFTSDPHEGRESWFVYDYFPGTYANDIKRFPRRQLILNWMAEAGLNPLPAWIAEQVNKPIIGRAILEDPFLEKHACSQLAMLSEAEYNAGLAAIRADLKSAEQRGETLEFQSSFTIWQLTGWNPL